MVENPAMLVENITPVLPVRDLQASLAFYIEMLGFTRDWGGDDGTPHIASVGRDGKSIMLVVGKDIAPNRIWIGIDDVTSLHDELVTHGARILQPPTNQPWALEMRVADPDGHVLWFGSEPRSE